MDSWLKKSQDLHLMEYYAVVKKDSTSRWADMEPFSLRGDQVRVQSSIDIYT